jgi:hypothetical protein
MGHQSRHTNDDSPCSCYGHARPLDELETSGRGARQEAGGEVAGGDLALVDRREAVDVLVAADAVSNLWSIKGVLLIEVFKGQIIIQ